MSDLLKLEAVNESGERIGHVHDVRFSSATRDTLGWTAASLIVGRGGFAARLGYAHGAVERPRAVAGLLSWLTRHAVEIPWARVVRVQEDRIVVSGTHGDFSTPSRGEEQP